MSVLSRADHRQERKYQESDGKNRANDPVAISEMGSYRYHQGDYESAAKYWTKAAELEDIRAHYELACLYRKGEGVEENEETAVYHWEKAAIGGHPDARHNLACYEGRNGNIERAVKHFIIAANLGFEKSMKALWEDYKRGNITKEELDATLRTHHAAINEMKSPEREAAEKVWAGCTPHTYSRRNSSSMTRFI